MKLSRLLQSACPQGCTTWASRSIGIGETGLMKTVDVGGRLALMCPQGRAERKPWEETKSEGGGSRHNLVVSLLVYDMQWRALVSLVYSSSRQTLGMDVYMQGCRGVRNSSVQMKAAARLLQTRCFTTATWGLGAPLQTGCATTVMFAPLGTLTPRRATQQHLDRRAREGLGASCSSWRGSCLEKPQWALRCFPCLQPHAKCPSSNSGMGTHLYALARKNLERLFTT